MSELVRCQNWYDVRIGTMSELVGWEVRLLLAIGRRLLKLWVSQLSATQSTIIFLAVMSLFLEN